MPMNLVIQEKRKELGLTQEQVAEYLNVSTPAVSKWEKGSTSPDLSLLPPLARLLKIDLNTLFCFQQDLSRQEITYFCRDLEQLIRQQGIAAGFEAADAKIREYPHSETLLQCLAFQLDGMLALFGQAEEETRPYDDMLGLWFRRLAKSKDCKVRISAAYMMVSRAIQKGDYLLAQEILDAMPNREEFFNGMVDKRMMQIKLDLCQGKADAAAKELQDALLAALNKTQLLLFQLIHAELACKNKPAAADLADKASRMAALFDLWEYDSYVGPMQVAVADQQADTCIRIARDMLAAILKPWDMGRSPLFCRIAKENNPNNQKQLLSAALSDFENNPAYGFLQDNPGWKALIDAYKTKCDPLVIPNHEM